MFFFSLWTGKITYRDVRTCVRILYVCVLHYYNTQAATTYNTLQLVFLTTTHCNPLQPTAIICNNHEPYIFSAISISPDRWHTATHWNTLQHTASKETRDLSCKASISFARCFLRMHKKAKKCSYEKIKEKKSFWKIRLSLAKLCFLMAAWWRKKKVRERKRGGKKGKKNLQKDTQFRKRWQKFFWTPGSPSSNAIFFANSSLLPTYSK